MPVLATRVISGKGLLRVDKDTSDFKKGRVFTVTSTVIRPPTTAYQNYNYNPPQSQYGWLTFLRNDYVILTEQIKYEQQSWEFGLDMSAQALYAVSCSYAGILQTFVNLGLALNLIPISVTNNIADWKHQDLLFDTIKLVCYGSTGVQLSLVSTPFSLCPDQQNRNPIPPPPPPSQPPKYPSTAPLDDSTTPVSPAYDGADDDGDTTPFESDAPTPPTVGCWETRTSYSAMFPITTDFTLGLPTDVPAFRLSSNGTVYQLYDSVTGRTMRSPWVGSSIVPTLLSAIWRSTCPDEYPGGAAP